MASPELVAAIEMMQTLIPELGAAASIDERRQGMEALQGGIPLPEDVTAQPIDAGGVPAEWVTTPRSKGLRIVLYFHGGGYVMGSLNTHRELVSRIARAAEARVLNVDYRLAPEHPYPAALDDAVAVYRWLLGEDVAPANIVVAGDSAGGGLALALLTRLRDEAIPLPAGAVLLSPWTDLSATGDSIQHRGALDPMIDADQLFETADHYCTTAQRTDPRVSPVYASFKQLPPLLIQVGGREVLFDDSIRVAELAEPLGVEVSLQVWDEAFHVFQAFPDLPESHDAVTRIGQFISRVIG